MNKIKIKMFLLINQIIILKFKNLQNNKKKNNINKKMNNLNKKNKNKNKKNKNKYNNNKQIKVK